MQELPPGFVLDGQPATQPTPQQYPGIIQGAPKAADPLRQNADVRDQRRLEIAEQTTALQNQLTELKLDAEREKQVEVERFKTVQAQGLRDSVAQMRRVVEAAQEAKTRSEDFFATGFGAGAAKGVGGTAASDVAALLNTVGSNTAFDRLQKMRDESPTGGALGAVSEIELALLRDSVASLDQSQSDEQFRANMDKVIESYQTVIDRLDPQASQTERESQEAPTARAPSTQDVYRNGVEFNIDKQEQSFDRSEYLQDNYGMEGDDEAKAIAFWNVNRGNTSLTPDMARQWYQSQGIPAPDDAGLAGMVEGVKAGREVNPIDTSAARESYESQLDGAIKAKGIDPESYTDTVRGKGSQGITLGLSDELRGGIGAAGALLSGENPVAAYGAERDIVRRQNERSAAANPGTSIASELGGGLLTGGLGARRSVAKGGMTLGRAAKEGAAFGGVGGFGYGEGAEGSAVNALGGAALGGVLGAGGQKVGNALANRAANKAGQATTGSEVQQASNALGMKPIPAMTGGSATQRLTGAARQGFVSDRPIAAAVNRLNERGGEVRGEIASNVGKVLDAEDAGEAIRKGANVYSKRTSEIGGKLYQRADRLAEGKTYPLPSAIQTVDDELAQLAKAPGGKQSSLFKDMSTLKKQMAGGKFPVDGIRAFRTRLRNEMTAKGLRGSPQDAAYNKVLKSAEEDMISGLRAAGNDRAVGALKTATDFWRKRVETIDEVLDPVIGKNAPRSGEQIVSALTRMANPKTGDASRLRRLMQSMPKDESASVRATVISRMGSPTAGKAELAEDAAFSFDTFLTNWNNMSERSKATMFTGDSMKALNQLATVSKGYKQAGASMNSSNTGGAILNQGAVSGALWLIDPIASGAGLISQHSMGKLLASPRFASWLAGAPKTANPKAKSQYLNKLGQIAKAEPTLAGEIDILQRAILDAANDNASRLSAIAEDSEQ